MNKNIFKSSLLIAGLAVSPLSNAVNETQDETNKIINTNQKEKLINIDEYSLILNSLFNINELCDLYNKKNGTNIKCFNFLEVIDIDNSIDGLNNALYSILYGIGKDSMLTNLSIILESSEYKGIYNQLGEYTINNRHYEAFNIYNNFYPKINSTSQLDVDKNLTDMVSIDTLDDPKFKAFIKSLEGVFGEPINEDLSMFINIFNKNSNFSKYIFTEELLEKLKNYIIILNIELVEYNLSLKDKLLFILTSFQGNYFNEEDLESLLNVLNIIKIYKNIGISITRPELVKIINQKYLLYFTNQLEESISEYGYLFNRIKSLNLFENFGLNDFSGIIYEVAGKNKTVLNNTNTNRFIQIDNSNRKKVGVNILNIMSKMDDDIKDLIDNNGNKLTSEDILENFITFISDFSNNINSVETLFLAWKSFLNYDNLSVDDKNKFNSALPILDNVDNIIYPINNNTLVVDNLGNLLTNIGDDSENVNLEEYFNNFQNKFKDVKIDYIPTNEELLDSDKIEELYFSLKNNWGIQNIKLSELYLINTQDILKNTIHNEESAKKWIHLKELYSINLDNLSELIGFNISGKNGFRMTYESSSITFYITYLLSSNYYQSFVTNKDLIYSNIILDTNNISLSDLFNNIAYINQNTGTGSDKIANTQVYNKLKTLGYSKNEFKKVLSSYLNKINTSSTGIQAFINLMLTNETKALDILDISENIFNNYYNGDIIVDRGEILGFVSDIYLRKSKFFTIGGIENFKKQLEYFKGLNIKIKDIEEFKVYSRSIVYDSNIEKILVEPDFKILNDSISKKYYNNKNSILSVLFVIEIYKYLENNENLKIEILNGNFDKLDRVISYVSKKFNVNNSHPFIINSSIRLVKGFENTSKIISKLEDLGEKVGSNDMSIISYVGKIINYDNTQTEFFYNKIKLINYINKNIYSRLEYERKQQGTVTSIESTLINLNKSNIDTSSIQTQYENMKKSYTERPELENMTLVQLWYIYSYNNVISVTNSTDLKYLILKDSADTTTEVGGVYYLDVDSKGKTQSSFFIDPSLSIGDEDHVYGMLNYLKPGIGFHFHALGLNNINASGPSGYGNIGGDFGYGLKTNSINAVITPLKENGEGIKVNYDLYWLDNKFNPSIPDYTHFKTIDFGTQVLK